MAKFNPLPSQERLKELFYYNEDTGVFKWKKPTVKWIKPGDIAGCKKDYILIGVDGIYYRAHRLAWMFVNDEDPGEVQIDHHDRNKHNNAIINLRKATWSQNQGNRPVQKNNKLGIKGIVKRGNRYRAQIIKNGKAICLGTYDTPEQAHEAYCKKAAELYGEFANFG